MDSNDFKSFFANLKHKMLEAKTDRLSLAVEHYTQLLSKIGFSDFKLDVRYDNSNKSLEDSIRSLEASLKRLDFTTNEATKFSNISCRLDSADISDVLFRDISYDFQDILEAIKKSECVSQEDYATHLIHMLKSKGFQGIKHRYHIEKMFSELSIIANKMEHKYNINIERHTTKAHPTSITQIDFDRMDGYQFENFCAELLTNRGYESVMVTQGSSDQGIDIIAYKDGIKYGIQCKCYSSIVGNKAVQEVFAGKAFYQRNVGIVITNNYFSNSAIELAHQNGIVLWNRDKLMQMVSESR